MTATDSIRRNDPVIELFDSNHCVIFFCSKCGNMTNKALSRKYINANNGMSESPIAILIFLFMVSRFCSLERGWK